MDAARFQGGREYSMDRKGSITMILKLISERGSASVESVIRELGRGTSPTELTEAFKGALTLGLIQTHRTDERSRELLYRLTPAGVSAVDQNRVLLLGDVLDVMTDFGVGSLELVAWELGVSENMVQRLWSVAIEAGFLERYGVDKPSGEEMWRLTESGRGVVQASRDSLG